MAMKVCVGNRQGGVGKSTVTIMLAHALAVLGKQRVLVIDLKGVISRHNDWRAAS